MRCLRSGMQMDGPHRPSRRDPLLESAEGTVRKSMGRVRVELGNFLRWMGYEGPKESFRAITDPQQMDCWKEVYKKEQKLTKLLDRLSVEITSLQENNYKKFEAVLYAIGFFGALALGATLGATMGNLTATITMGAIAVFFGSKTGSTIWGIINRYEIIEELENDGASARNEFRAARKEYNETYPHFQYD